MKVSISGRKLAQCLSDKEECIREHGDSTAGAIYRRLAQLSAAPSLATMRNMGRCREVPEKEGVLHIDASEDSRIVFKTVGEGYSGSKGLLWGKVVEIEIIDIENN